MDLLNINIRSILFLCVLFIGMLFTSCEKSEDIVELEPESAEVGIMNRASDYLEITQLESEDDCCVYLVALVNNTDHAFIELGSKNPNISIEILPGAILDPLRWRVEYCPNEEVDNGSPFVQAYKWDIVLTANLGGYILCETNLDCDVNTSTEPCPLLELTRERTWPIDDPDFGGCTAYAFTINGIPPLGCMYSLKVGPRGGVKALPAEPWSGTTRICSGDTVQILLTCGEGEPTVVCEYIAE